MRNAEMQVAAPSKILLSIALFLAPWLVFGRACSYGYTNFDDPSVVENNAKVLTGLTRENVAWAFTTVHTANWFPLTWLSLQADAQLYGTAPLVPGPLELGPGWGFHITNILVHGASTVLLFHFLLLVTGASWRSFLVAGFFALHPLRVESVVWIAERKDVLSSFFWMVTCLVYGWYAAKPAWPRYLAALIAFAGGLLAKPMLVSLPFVLLLLDYWPLGRLGGMEWRWRGPQKAKSVNHLTGASLHYSRLGLLVLEKVPFFVLAAVSCAVTWYAQQTGGAIRSLEEYPLGVRAGNAVLSYVVYLRQMFWPLDLGLLYPHPATLAGRLRQVVGAALLLSLISAFVCVKARSFPYLPVGWLWYLGTLVPVIGLVQVGYAAHADRYTYIPLIGLSISVIWGAADWAQRWGLQKIALSGGIVLVGICAGLCWTQVGYWRNNASLWDHTLTACGGSAAAHHNLAMYSFEVAKNDRPPAPRDELLETAVRHFREAMRLDPNNSAGGHFLAMALHRQGKTQQAIEQYRQNLRKNPQSSQDHWGLGLVFHQQGLVEEAIAEEKEALRCDPSSAQAEKTLGDFYFDKGAIEQAAGHYQAAMEKGNAEFSVYYNLACAYALRGQFARAIDPVQRALALEPENWRCHSLFASVLDSSGNHQAAEDQFRVVSQLNPTWQDSLNQEAWVRATDPNPKKRNGNHALLLARQTCQATKNREPRFLDTLAAAYAETGQFALAAEAVKQAMAVIPSGQENLLASLKQRLEGYEKGRPYRSGPEAALR